MICLGRKLFHLTPLQYSLFISRKAFNNGQMSNNYRGKKPLPVNSKGKLPSFPNKFPIRKDREKLINVQPTDRCVGTPTHSVSCRRIIKVCQHKQQKVTLSSCQAGGDLHHRSITVHIKGVRDEANETNAAGKSCPFIR